MANDGPSPRRVAAGKANRAKRGPLTQVGLDRLRAVALANRPWEHSTGPTTAAGKAKVAATGRYRQVGPMSVRAARAEAAAANALVAALRAARKVVVPGQ